MLHMLNSVDCITSFVIASQKSNCESHSIVVQFLPPTLSLHVHLWFTLICIAPHSSFFLLSTACLLWAYTYIHVRLEQTGWNIKSFQEAYRIIQRDQNMDMDTSDNDQILLVEDPAQER